MRRLLLLPVLELAACLSPDEFRLGTYAGQTDYAHQTDIWDSNNWGAEASLAWDLGNRAKAHEATVLAMEGIRHDRIERGRPPVKVESESNTAEIVTALTVLAGAAASWFQRHNIARGVKGIHARVTRKKMPKP